MSWPGLSGINLKQVQAKGRLPGVDVTLEATNSRLSYRGLATHIDTAVLHIHLLSDADTTKPPLSINDLSLPRFHLSAKLPALTVKQAQLAIHFANSNFVSNSLTSNSLTNNSPGKKADNKADQPIVIALQGFELDPADHGHFQLDTAATIVGQQHINGHFEVTLSPAELSAQMRFPADQEAPPWLNIAFVQRNGTDGNGTDRNSTGRNGTDGIGTGRNDTDSATSELRLQFDETATHGQWLDALLNTSSAGRVTHTGGQLQAQAIFNGDQTRPLSQLSLNARQFQVDLDGNTGVIDADIKATREAQSVLVEFVNTADSGAGRLVLVDRNKTMETAIKNTVPELTRSSDAAPDAAANAELSLSSGSQLLLNLPENAAEKPSLSFSGGLALDYSTGVSSVHMNLDDLSVAISELAQTDLNQASLTQAGQIDLTGNLVLNWKEKEPFSYANETLSVAANSLSLQAAGALAWSPGQISFQSTGQVDAQLPGLQAKIQTGDQATPGWIEFSADDLQASQAQLGFEVTGFAPDTQLSYVFNGPLSARMPEASIFSSAKPEKTTLTANEFNLNVTLVSDQSQFKTDGNGYLSTAEVMPLEASASRLDIKWADLSLTDLTGTLDTKTRGFKVAVNEDTWTDFDLEASINLLKNDDIKGSGKLSFGSALSLPIEFSGNTVSGWWDINLPKHTLPINGLRGVLRSAQIEVPEDLRLTDGTISVTGLIQVHDQISAKLDLSGSEIAAVLVESNAQQASFHFDAGYLTDIFATGPIAVRHLELAGGIDINDLSLDLKLENSQAFGLSNISAQLFDGQLKIDQLNYADTAIEDTRISLTHINLTKLLAYLDVDGLDGTGFIDFSLPAGSRGAAVHIIDGTFTSTGPGRLSYSKGDMAGANIGLKALDNFQYKQLSGNIAYDSTGPYQITIRLEGSNPDLYDGYPVIFNLTIHGSLPELFEAMFMTGNFEESILEQIKMK